MTVHLIKLCVGIDSVEQLEQAFARRLAQQRAAGRPEQLLHKTRHRPRRAEEVLDGGSLYWVIKGIVAVRQPICALEPDTGEDGHPCCAIHLEKGLVRTEAFPYRPFQGWRYLDPSKAPPDLPADQGDDPQMPPTMVAELRALGLL